MRKSKFLQSSKDMLHRGFKAERCKTSLRLVTSRLKLLRNKKEVQVKQMKREIAQLLESGQDRTARIKVEHVVREEKMMAAFELIGLYSELTVSRLPIIESQKNCPIDLKEAITSLIFASPRCGDVPELVDVQKHFTAKYGKEFVTSALELRPDCGVSRMLVEKLSAKAPDGQTKLKLLSAIADEHSIKWDPKSYEENELSAPNDLLSGPNTFEYAKGHNQSPRHEPLQNSHGQIHNQPLKPEQYDNFSQGSQSVSHTHNKDRTPSSSPSQYEVRYSATERPGKQSLSEERSSIDDGKNFNMDFKDAASAAQAAAESAERASMAARAAAELANRDSMKNSYYTESHQSGPTHLRRDSSELAVERPPRDPYSRYSSSDKERGQGVGYNNQGGAPERFNQDDHDYITVKNARSNLDGYDSAEKYSQPSNLRSNASSSDDAFGHGTLNADEYSPKSFYEEGDSKLDSVVKTHIKQSESTRDIHESSRSDDFSDILAENTVMGSDTCYRFQPNIYDDDRSASDLNLPHFESQAAADFHDGIDEGYFHRDTSREASGHSTFAVFDEAGSDDAKILFDTGSKYDDQDSDLDSMSLEREAPSNFFTSPSAHDYGLHQSPKKSVLLPQSSTEKHSTHELSDIEAASVDEFKFEDPLPTKYDDSDKEGSVDESGHSGRTCSEKCPGSRDQILPSSRTLIKNQGYQGYDEKPHLKSTPDESDDETLSRTSSDLSSRLNFGNLTGGLRHKRYGLPPYRRSQVDDASSSLKNPVEESFSTISDSPTSVTTQSEVNAEVKQYKSDRSNHRASESHNVSDIDSSEDEHSAQISGFRREPYSQHAEKETETNSKLEGSDPYFESGSDDFFKGPIRTPAGRNHLPSGLSRRTKTTPGSSGTPKVQTKHYEPNDYNFGSERISPRSSYYSPPEEPESQTRSSSQSINFEQSISTEASSEQMPDYKNSLHQESSKSACVQQPASSQQKLVGTYTIKGSQASPSEKDPVIRVDSSEKASHVHPKLPDYDSFVAHLGSLRKNRP